MIKHQLEFLLIGAFVVIVNGCERGTADMDLWLNPTIENKHNFISAFREYGISEIFLHILKSFDSTGEVRFFMV